MNAIHVNTVKNETERGFTLVIVVSIILICSTMAGAVILASSAHYRLTGRQNDLEKALYVAEGGLELAAQYLSRQYGYAGQTYSSSGSIGQGQYAYTMNRIGFRLYSMVCTGRVNGISREVSIERVYIPTYAKFALWMNENGVIYFIPGEEFDGYVHSNDKLWFDSSSTYGGPEFWKEVTSASSTYGGNIDYVTFHEGFEMNAQQGDMAQVDFNSSSQDSLRSIAQANGVILQGQTSIRFDGDTMYIDNYRRGWNNHAVPIGEDSIVYVENTYSEYGSIILEGGEVDGRLTLVSEGDMIIKDHINYSDDPMDDDEVVALGGQPSNDALGLISKDDIWVHQSAPDDLQIYAAMMATGQYSGNEGSFGVLDYNYGSPRGDLGIYGSLVQDVRGAVGTFRYGSSSTGYSKQYIFDPRFEENPPPFYPPLDNEIRFEGWREQACR